MARADIHGGNDVYFIDVGITNNDGIKEAAQVGAIDNRAGFKLETADPALIDSCDVIVAHTGIPDHWIVRNQIPLIWMVHGRPLACFRPEQNGKSNSYSLYSSVSKWPRTKKMLYFWPEFKPFWDVCIPKEKHLILDYPVIDQNRFNSRGQRHVLENKGKYNLLICDSSREDVDLYELVTGCVEACKKIEGLKIHFYGFDYPIPNCWDIVLSELKRIGGLGDVVGRVSNMELVYRAVDCLISPNRIITRTIAESICCGTPVIADNNCTVADYTCNMTNPFDILEAIEMFRNDFDNNMHKNGVLERSKVFSMDNYCEIMNKVYSEVITCK